MLFVTMNKTWILHGAPKLNPLQLSGRITRNKVNQSDQKRYRKKLWNNGPNGEEKNAFTKTVKCVTSRRNYSTTEWITVRFVCFCLHRFLQILTPSDYNLQIILIIINAFRIYGPNEELVAQTKAFLEVLDKTFYTKSREMLRVTLELSF